MKQIQTNITRLHRTQAARQNTIEVIITSDAVYTERERCNKSPAENCCRIRFMMYWHKSNYFQRRLYRVQCRQTLAVAVRVPTRGSISVWQSIASDVDTLSYREETKQHRRDRRPSAPWVLSSAGKLIRYLHGSYFLPYRSADVSLFCFYLPSLSFCHSAVHWTLSSYHE